MADQSLFEGGEPRHALLAQRRQVAADASKLVSADERAEEAQIFLLDFDHADIALSKTVVKGHGRVFQEGEYGILVEGEGRAQKFISLCRYQ